MQLAELLEAMMIISFGISWPLSIIRSYRSRSTKGKSIFFSFFILFGYLCGIAAKILSGNINYVLVVYFLNLITVCLNLLVYFRNRGLDRRAAETRSASRKPAVA